MIGLLVAVGIFAVIVVGVVRRLVAPSTFWTFGRSGSGPQSGDRRSALRRKLDEWVSAEVMDRGEAETLLAYELEQAASRPKRVPPAAEAAGYIGSVLVVAAIVLLFRDRWDGIPTAGRVLSVALPTAAAVVGGWWTGRSDEPALSRLGSVLWLVAVLGVAGTAGVVWVDAIHGGDPPNHHAVLFIGSMALLAAGSAWWRRPFELQHLALLGATITTTLGVVDTVGTSLGSSMSMVTAGLVLVALGGAWVVAGLPRWLAPAVVADLSGSALMLVGAQFVRIDNDHLGLWLGLVLSAVLLTVGVLRAKVEFLVIGTAGLFQWIPQIAFFYLKDTLGVEATAFAIGSMLVLLVGLLIRMYPLVGARHRREPALEVDATDRASGP